MLGAFGRAPPRLIIVARPDRQFKPGASPSFSAGIPSATLPVSEEEPRETFLAGHFESRKQAAYRQQCHEINGFDAT